MTEKELITEICKVNAAHLRRLRELFDSFFAKNQKANVPRGKYTFSDEYPWRKKTKWELENEQRECP